MKTLDKMPTPVPDRNRDVFVREWPLRVADIDRHGRLRLRRWCSATYTRW